MLRIVVIVAIAIQSVYVVQSNKTQHLHHWNDGRIGLIGLLPLVAEYSMY
jgi:hypothetical protein